MLIDGVHGALTQVGVEDDTVQEILDMLREAEDYVRRGSDIEHAPSGSYGGAPTGAELALHAGKAHHHVVEAMTQMVAGLTMYHDSVAHFRKDVHETDSTQATEYLRRSQRTEQVPVETLIDMGAACAAPPDFSANESCAPTEEGDA